jgi:hypothetical protein
VRRLGIVRKSPTLDYMRSLYPVIAVDFVIGDILTVALTIWLEM